MSERVDTWTSRWHIPLHDRLDFTLGYIPSSRDTIISSRTQQNNSTPRYRTNRIPSQPRTGQLTVLEYLQGFNERLTLVEQQMSSMTSVLQRIDDRLQPPTDTWMTLREWRTMIPTTVLLFSLFPFLCLIHIQSNVFALLLAAFSTLTRLQ